MLNKQSNGEKESNYFKELYHDDYHEDYQRVRNELLLVDEINDLICYEAHVHLDRDRYINDIIKDQKHYQHVIDGLQYLIRGNFMHQTEQLQQQMVQAIRIKDELENYQKEFERLNELLQQVIDYKRQQFTKVCLLQ